MDAEDLARHILVTLALVAGVAVVAGAIVVLATGSLALALLTALSAAGAAGSARALHADRSGMP